MSTDSRRRVVLVRGAAPSQRTRGRSFPVVRTSFAAVTVAMPTPIRSRAPKTVNYE
jgi:hypothetical protein